MTAQAQRVDQNEEGAAEQSRPRKQPVDKFQDGPVQASIFQNPSTKGDFRTATLQVRYKDRDGEFQTSHSYTAGALKHIASASIEAAERISRWEEENKAKAQSR